MNDEGGSMDAMVDSGRYPLSDPTSRRDVVERVRRELAHDGCCVLPGFVRPEHQATLRAQAAEVAPRAYYDVRTVNVYNTGSGDGADPRLSPTHPGRRSMRRGNAFVARDLIPAGHLIHRLYTSALFRRFIAECVGCREIHELADPLSGLVLNVLVPGRSHPWHFDTNEFTVSLFIQAAEGGGVFEYCPAIRSTVREDGQNGENGENGENTADVRAVLDGRGEHLVRRLRPRPGDLQLFAGRYALHRVTEVTGPTARHTAIFAYCERPGVVGTVARTHQLFGRVTGEHLAARERAVPVDGLLT